MWLQSPRAIEVFSPLGQDVLVFARMSGGEALGRLFEYELDLLAETDTLDLNALLGQPLTVRLERLPEGQRYFHGIISRIAFAGSVGRHARYRVTLRPWLWLLTRRSDCRIFQPGAPGRTPGPP